MANISFMLKNQMKRIGCLWIHPIAKSGIDQPSTMSTSSDVIPGNAELARDQLGMK
jgi:hypothetical protein